MANSGDVVHDGTLRLQRPQRVTSAVHVLRQSLVELTVAETGTK